MKKIISLISIIIIVFVLVGCGSGPKSVEDIEIQADSGKGEILTIKDYYPFKENIVMDYQGIGNEFAEQKIYIEFIDDNKAQFKIENPGTVLVRVVEYSNGTLTELFKEGEFYHIENMLNANPNSNNIILKEPLAIGTTWTNLDGNTVTITSINQSIETPSGTYEALEVTTEFDEGITLKKYFARDIGEVASVYTDGEFKVETLLQSIQNKEQKIGITTYYPTVKDVNTEYIIQDILFKTNDSIEEILEDLMKNPPSSELFPAISENTRINKIHLNRNSWTLEIDFSKELLLDMNAGSAFETELIKSIVNTLGSYYDVDKVYITVEDKPYESGHYGLKPDEYFKVDTIDIKEFTD